MGCERELLLLPDTEAPPSLNCWEPGGERPEPQWADAATRSMARGPVGAAGVWPTSLGAQFSQREHGIAFFSAGSFDGSVRTSRADSNL